MYEQLVIKYDSPYGWKGQTLLAIVFGQFVLDCKVQLHDFPQTQLEVKLLLTKEKRRSHWIISPSWCTRPSARKRPPTLNSGAYHDLVRQVYRTIEYQKFVAYQPWSPVMLPGQSTAMLVYVFRSSVQWPITRETNHQREQWTGRGK